MSARLFAVATFALVIAGSPQAQATAAAGADPCTMISLDEEPLSARDRFLRFIDKWWNRSEEIQTEPEAPPGELYFTVHSGFFYMPLCTGQFGDDPEMRRWMPYPVGLVVRPLATAMISGADYRLVETEYGLRAYVPAGYFAPIEPHNVYFFPGSNTPLDFCPEGPECYDDEQQHLWIQEHRYAVAHGAVARISGDRCGIYEAELFERHDSLLRTIYINPCFPYGVTGMLKGNVKIVTLSEYRRLFDVDVSGVYLRLTPKFMDFILPDTTHTRACGEFDIKNLKATVGGGVEVSVPLHVMKLNAGGKLEGMLMRTQEEGKGLFSFYSPYAFYSSELGSDIYVIEAISRCDSPNALPDDPYALIVIHAGGNIGKLTVTVEAILQRYRDLDKLKLYEPTKAHYLEQGQFWTVQDIHQYLDLRDILREVTMHGGLKEEIIRTADNPFEFMRVIDFFAHLLMAATTYFNPPLAFSENTPLIIDNFYPGFGAPPPSVLPSDGTGTS